MHPNRRAIASAVQQLIDETGDPHAVYDDGVNVSGQASAHVDVKVVPTEIPGMSKVVVSIVLGPMVDGMAEVGRKYLPTQKDKILEACGFIAVV